jgi:hypothetical protein
MRSEQGLGGGGRGAGLLDGKGGWKEEGRLVENGDGWVVGGGGGVVGSSSEGSDGAPLTPPSGEDGVPQKFSL